LGAGVLQATNDAVAMLVIAIPVASRVIRVLVLRVVIRASNHR
jgi:hypothetical protein